jgi:hypothetical protein
MSGKYTSKSGVVDSYFYFLHTIHYSFFAILVSWLHISSLA